MRKKHYKTNLVPVQISETAKKFFISKRRHGDSKEPLYSIVDRVVNNLKDPDAVDVIGLQNTVDKYLKRIHKLEERLEQQKQMTFIG